MANADTPNFKAKDIDFASVLREKLFLTANTNNVGLTKRPQYVGVNTNGALDGSLLYRVPLQPSAMATQWIWIWNGPCR